MGDTPWVNVRIQTDDFDVSAELAALQSSSAGAVAMFVGTVRSSEQEPIDALELEHYPGMTERSIGGIIDEAALRWPLLGVCVIHRVGALAAGDRIVFVGVAAAHRGAAFNACEFVMDYLKTRAPLWKKAVTPAGEEWVASKAADQSAADRWAR